MFRKRNIFFICAGTLLFSSCEKDITVDLPAAPKMVVVEGIVEQGKHPYVLLTRNSGYFDPINDFLNNLFVTDAIVVMSDGVIIDTVPPALDNEILTPYPVMAYRSDIIVGEVGKTYYLTVIADGKTLTSKTTIPQPIPLDSLWFKLEPGHHDSLGFIWAHLSDPDTLGNNYRWFTRIFTREHRFIPPDGSQFNDKFINGTSFDFAYDHKDDPLNSQDTSHHHFFKLGDTVAVKFCTMDYNSYNFWNSVDIGIQSNGNPFAAPFNVFSNINGGLGVWCGYGTSIDTLILKK